MKTNFLQQMDSNVVKMADMYIFEGKTMKDFVIYFSSKGNQVYKTLANEFYRVGATKIQAETYALEYLHIPFPMFRSYRSNKKALLKRYTVNF